MAQVLGESGRYVTEQAVSGRIKQFRWTLYGVFACGFLGGSCFFLFFFTFQRPYVALAMTVVLFIAVEVIRRKLEPKLDALERDRLAMRKGAVGEEIIGKLLEELPDQFRVINDLATRYGNVDHVVVGPTGVFMIDAKHWRGVVEHDGKGGLLLNGQPTDKPLIKHFVSRVMNIKTQIKALATAYDPYFQSVFAFVGTQVNADFGKTGYVHCVRDDRLIDYVTDVNNKWPKRLDEKAVSSLSQAFLALARMEKDFVTKESAQ